MVGEVVPPGREDSTIHAAKGDHLPNPRKKSVLSELTDRGGTPKYPLSTHPTSDHRVTTRSKLVDSNE